MTKRLRAYIIYNQNYGPQEGAFLTFHFTGREAKKLFWPRCPFDFVDYIDVTWRWIQRLANVAPLANQEKLANNQPHIVDAPEYCATCEIWGCGITEDKKCRHCGEDPGEKLLKLFEKGEPMT